LAGVGGGIVAVQDGEIMGLVELPIAGLMSDGRARSLVRKLRKCRRHGENSAALLSHPL